uniref:Uncharacterized protein n=1 Tax=Attheya septentrionalis TaxID=420275 RepID=A0A7S2U8P8_9STRA
MLFILAYADVLCRMMSAMYTICKHFVVVTVNIVIHPFAHDDGSLCQTNERTHKNTLTIENRAQWHFFDQRYDSLVPCSSWAHGPCGTCISFHPTFRILSKSLCQLRSGIRILNVYFNQGMRRMILDKISNVLCMFVKKCFKLLIRITRASWKSF